MEKNQIRVLLAEDDRNLGNILKNFLDAKGYATTLCVNGQEAAEIFKKKEFDFGSYKKLCEFKNLYTKFALNFLAKLPDDSSRRRAIDVGLLR